MPLPPTCDFVGKTWDILIDKAYQHESIGYGALLKLVTGETKQYPGRHLRPILDFLTGYCVGLGAPPLTVIVVTKTTKRPSKGFEEVFPNIEAARKDVFSYNWQNHPPPTF